MADARRIEIRFWAMLWMLVLAYGGTTLLKGSVDGTQFARLLGDYLLLSIRMMTVAAAVGAMWLLFREPNALRQSPLARLTQSIEAGWQRDRLVSALSPPLLFAVLMASFNTYKQTLLERIDFRFDPLLAQIDRALFFGYDPWALSHRVFDAPWATYIIDKAYHAWFVPMGLGIILCAFVPAKWRHLRMRYLISYVLVWIVLGSIVAGLIPAAGPCFQPNFVGPGTGFDAMLHNLDADLRLVRLDWPTVRFASLDDQQGLLSLYGAGELAMGGGISAMPSVHNALATLFALAAFQIDRRAGVVFAGYAVVIWIGSVHLGWHYVVDGPAGAVMTYALWRLAGRIADGILLGTPDRLRPPVLNASLTRP